MNEAILFQVILIVGCLVFVVFTLCMPAVARYLNMRRINRQFARTQAMRRKVIPSTNH